VKTATFSFATVLVAFGGLHVAAHFLRRARTIICGALMALAITTANAAKKDKDSANFLLPHCKFVNDQTLTDIHKAFYTGRCTGIVQTIVEMLGLLKREREAGVQLDPTLCADVPPGVTNGQILQVVIRFGETHPNMTHAPFLTLAMVALNSAWPCPPSPTIPGRP
jgi:hypothetical protein